ncbi:MAG: peptidoglycan-binding protein [Neomegalonema sp.]|nr:peptidoglycan-binding protein [Neomegalonema sp.]
MTTSFTKSLALGAAFTLAAAASASAKPDLVIKSVKVDEASISCAKGPALVKVTLLIENTGDKRADWKLVERVAVGVAVDDAPYTWVLGRTANDLDPGEVARIVLEIGKGMEKKGRIGSIPEGAAEPYFPTNTRSQAELPEALRFRIQEELKKGGFYTGAIDGGLGRGSQRAVRAYQKSIGARQTGWLSEAQALRLLADGESWDSYFATERAFKIIVIADPKGNIDESDESNNLVKTEDSFLLTGCK